MLSTDQNTNNGKQDCRQTEATKISEDEAHEFAESIINTVREPLISLDHDLRVVTVNRSFYEFFKVKPEETVGQLIYNLGNGQWDIPRLRELLETILPEKTTFDNYEVEHEFSIIGRRIMLLNARQIKRAWGKERIILLAIEDITKHKLLEDLLAESEERYRRLFETASDGIVLLEKNEGSIINANPATAKMLGYPKEECLGKKLHDIGVSLDMSDFPALMQDLKKNGILNYDDVPVKTKSGQFIDTDMYMVDKANLAQFNIRDVTQRKKLEAQLRQAQKMEAVGLLAGGIAHDFNNILNVILGYGVMVQDSLAAGSPAVEQMKEVLIAADRAADLTRRLLLFSRKEVAEVKPINVNQIVMNMEKMLSRIIGEDIGFVTDLMGQNAVVMADAGQMEQVLMNLATNARDAMPKGGSLTMKTELKTIDTEFVDAYEYGAPGAYAVISVTDTGTGIEKEKLTRIFDPFFTTKEAGKGTGLGLSIVYGIIKQHHGYITVYSEPGYGSVFKIYLPLLEDGSAAQVKQAEAPVAVPGGNETILMAEDDASLRKLTRIILESFGYRVIAAVDGEDAISKFMENRERINLVMLDMIMPGKNGKEVSEMIRAKSPGTKILFVSGYPMEMSTNRELAESDFEFINKPVTSKDLLKKVREILDR